MGLTPRPIPHLLTRGLRVFKLTLVKLTLFVAALAAAVVLAPSGARAAVPEFLEANDAPEAAAVTLLAVGDNQTLVGPPVRARDTDGDTLTYSLSDGIYLHASFFTINPSTGQISRKSYTPRGLYRVRVSASDGTDTTTVDVTIYVTSAGKYPQEDSWVRARSMTATDGTAHDFLGWEADATDDIIVAGAQWADSSTIMGPEAGPGAAYVFDANSGAQLARLDSPNQTADGWFGSSVSVAGDTIVVGAWGEATSGQAHVYVKPSSGWASTSTATATLTPAAADHTPTGGTPSGKQPIQFGWSVSISGDGNTVVVGARQWENIGDSQDAADLDDDGAAFVFTKPSGGWADADTDDTGVVRLFAGSRLQRYSHFGEAVAISADGDTIAVGAPFDTDTLYGQGLVYLFTKGAGWANTTLMTTPLRVKASDPIGSGKLGAGTVALSDDGSTLATGAGGPGRAGAAYVFVRPAGGWVDDATEAARLSTFGHPDDGFAGAGVVVSPSGDRIAVPNAGTRSSNFRGSAYVYTKPSGGWADDSDSQGDNVRVLTVDTADTNLLHRYAFADRGLAFVGEDKLVVGQPSSVWTLRSRDGMSSVPTGGVTLTDGGGLYGANIDMSVTSRIPQGSVHLFKLRSAVQQPAAPPPPPPPPPPDDPEESPEPEPEPEPPEFADVDEDSVHAESIEEVAALGITSGTTATMFSPSEPVTRAQMATFVARTWEATGRECPSLRPLFFDDVAAGSTHAGSIDCVSALGVARGTEDRMFSPSADVSRAQMATFLARAWMAAGQTCPASDADSIFDDVPADSTHAENIGCIAALGITRGTAAGMFSPSDTVTRAQMATFLARFHEALTDTA